MMLKTEWASADFHGEPRVTRVPVLHDGRLGPNDRTSLIKRAGVQFVEALRDVRLAPDEVPVHTIALGATEDYGPNRNSDGFKRACCERYHDTFVKFGRWYRNHQNKNADKSYGRIIKSAYNDPMKRVELLVGLNGSEKTAKANGGLVADKEIEKLDKHQDIPTSMACKVAYDECSGCGNKARHRGEYCTGKTCERGGLAEKIGSIDEDGHQLHADNPHPTWFDESMVYKAADRIAASLGVLEKSAAARLIAGNQDRVVSGAELAEQIGLAFPAAVAFDPSAPRHVAAQVKLAHALATLESQVGGPAARDLDAAISPQVGGPITDIPDAQATGGRLGEILGALATEKVALPLEGFLTLMLADEAQAQQCVDEVAAQLPGVFTRLAKEAGLRARIEASPYNPGRGVPPLAIREWARKQASGHSLAEPHVRARAVTAALRDVVPEVVTLTKEAREAATDEGGAERMAREYALYKIAFLAAIEAAEVNQNPLTPSLLVRSHYLKLGQHAR